MLEKGMKAPRFTLEQAAGAPVSLGAILEDRRRVLLIFLRYLG